MSTSALAALLFCSGFTALVFETLWVREVSLIVGIDVLAVTTVVSGFFAGLGVGSWAFGRRADRVVRPLALYAALEIGVAVLGAGVTLGLPLVAAPYARLAAAVGPLARLLPFVLVATPALLMGGTLPAAVRAATPTAAGVARTAGLLYAANTAGGVAGALATVLLLVPAAGMRGSALLAATLSAVTAGLAWRLARPAAAPAGAEPPAGSRRALGLYAAAGAVALGCEIVWTQATAPFLGTRATAFAVVIAVYLLGLVVGSALYARVAGRLRRPWVAFGLLELAFAASVLTTFAALGPWLPAAQEAANAALRARTGSLTVGFAAHLLLPPLAILLVPALLLGAAFPAAARLACGPDRVGTDVGAVTAANTIGGIAGTWVTGFVAVPLLGIRGALLLLAVGAATVGAVALAEGTGGRRLTGWTGAAAVAGLAAVGLRIPRDHLAQAFASSHIGSLVAYEESAGGIVAVVEEPWFQTSFRRLYIQGMSNSGDGLMSRRYMRLQALLPLLLHEGESRAAMVVGLGTGITCGSLLVYPGLERRVCVELLPAVVRAVHHFAGNFDVATDRRAEIRIADGRQDLLVHDDRYDLITLEPPPPVGAGVVNLYSRDFYDLCRRRLAPHGLMAQWLPLSTQNDEDTRALVRSFLDAFPEVTLWSTELHEMLLIGSVEPLAIDPARVAERLHDAGVAQALAEVGVPDLEALLATYVTDRRGLEAYAGDAPPVTDDRPRIEHAGLVRPGAFPLTLAHVLASRANPELVGAEAGLAERIARRRERLFDFYQASIYWYAGQTDQVDPLLRRVFDAEPDNPYFRWFVGG